MFYPDVKPHISPSALSAWHRQRSLFVRSYFKGEKSPETSAMKAGTKIHGLIEAGFHKATYIFKNPEAELSFPFRETGVLVLGKPDSYELKDDTAYFVDYKTGRENHWTREELATDLKMRTTAWLVWQATGKPEKVYGYLEWIGTQWDGKEIVPTGETDSVEYCYSREEMEDFENTIQKTIDEVNEAYPIFLQSDNSLVDEEDVEEYARLQEEITEREAKQAEIKERIGEQLTVGNCQSFESVFGTFYFTERKTYKYPDDLPVNLGDGKLITLKEAEDVSTAASVAKKNYEGQHDPVSTSRSIGFRAKKSKGSK